MAGNHKMAPIFLFFFLILVSAHNEGPGNQLDYSSDTEGSHGADKSYRRDAAWSYDGIPIEVPENRRLASDTEGTTTTASTTTSTTTTTPETRKPYPPLHPRYRRIYNPDEKATIDEYPFMAAVLVNKELWCGAAVIDKDRVLTAAHCLQLQYNNRFFREYVKMLTVRVGSTNATAGGEVLKVVEISFHPNYKPDVLGFNVAVLKLHKNMSFDRPDAPVDSIPYAHDIILTAQHNVTFLGWGSVLGRGGRGGTVLLQKLDLPMYDLADCQQVYGKDLVTTTNFCAGFIAIPKNVCNHDAGGPAILDGVLVGILSFSSRRCDAADQPAVFTRISAVSSWLDELDEAKQKLPSKVI